MTKLQTPLSERLYALFVWLLLLGTGIFVAGAIALGIRWKMQLFPDVAVLQRSYPVAVGKIEKRNIYQFKTAKPAYWRALSEISSVAVAAILISEDGGFYHHEGYEPELMKKAWEENRKAGKYKRGASTITQQVVKNLFLSPEKTLTRKLRELLLAIELERRFTKQKILETYLNIAEWGPGVYGIEQASNYYFGKSAAALDSREGAILAYLLPNPLVYGRSVRSGELTSFGNQRVSNILDKLSQTGKLPKDEYPSAPDDTELPSDIPSEEE